MTEIGHISRSALDKAIAILESNAVPGPFVVLVHPKCLKDLGRKSGILSKRDRRRLGREIRRRRV